jgi:hypothetical protein
MPERFSLTSRQPPASAEVSTSGAAVVSLRRWPAGVPGGAAIADAFEFFPAIPGAPASAPVFGIEEIFPARRAGKYPLPPYEKVAVAEGGDLRGKAWQAERRDNGVRLWVADKRFGYKFEKRLAFPEPAPGASPRSATLRIEYRLDNVADERMLYAWAARIALPLHDNVELTLPKGLAWDRQWSEGTAATPVPETLRPTVLREPSRLAEGLAGLWICSEPLRSNVAVWTDKRAGKRLTVTAPADAVPHLGLEIDRRPGRVPVVALVPTNSPLDSLSALRHRARPHHWAEPLQAREWWLELSLEEV